MTPKEKAKELYDLFYSVIELTESDFPIKNSVKEATRVCVGEIIKCFNSMGMTNPDSMPYRDYNLKMWQQVKQEIEKL